MAKAFASIWEKQVNHGEQSVLIRPSFIDILFGSDVEKIIVGSLAITLRREVNIEDIQWPNRRSDIQIKKGRFFSHLKVNSIVLGYLTEKQVRLLEKIFIKGWFESQFSQFRLDVKILDESISNHYVKHSEFDVLLQRADYMVSKFVAPPEKGLLNTSIAEPYDYLWNFTRNFRRVIDRKRAEFVKIQKNKHKEYFDSVEANPLTERQREACIVDNDNNLVLAGAGTGKTSVMVGKAGYLVKERYANPDEILLLAYGKDAQKELDERIREKLGTDRIRANTFHALGKSIIEDVEKRSVGVTDFERGKDKAKLKKFIDNTFQELMGNQNYARLSKEYFEAFLCPAANIFDFDSIGAYYQYLKDNDIITLKGEPVRSYEEVLIANFLYQNGIEYVYEHPYSPSQTSEVLWLNTRKYTPDFYLPEHDIYIEHYGINRAKETAKFIDSEAYRNEMDWKRKTHHENGTVCIETFHYERVEGNLLDCLKERLVEKGVVIEPISEHQFLEKLRDLGAIEKFSELLTDMLIRVKSCAVNKLGAMRIAENSGVHSDQVRAGLSLLFPIWDAYEDKLQDEGRIDFNDMIGRAIKYIESGRFEGAWKYIMVDEFQDISEPRARFVKCLLDHVKSSVLFCVGDDWQAIYRFAGSDLSLTTQFKKKFGDYDETRLDKTFRFNNKISDVASRFVMKNDAQFEKDIKTHSTVENPAVVVYRTRDSKSIDEICVVLDAINTAIKDKVSVLLLSRYKKGLPEKSDLKRLSNQYPQIEFTFMSAHKSKGSEADFVIVTGADKGFPSEKTTHPLIEAFLPPSEPFPFAEERRLFYVALTRAKRKVYLLANMERPSNFIKELLSEEDYDIAIDDFDVSDSQRNAQISHCPECKTGTLAYREGPYGRFVKCSNDPRCKYSDNRLDCEWCDGQMVRKSESKHCSNESCNFKIAYCPSCWGDLVYRKNGNLYGCTNYRKNYSGSCDHIEKWIDFDNLN